MSVFTPSVSPFRLSSPAIPADFIWRLSVSQYHDMIRNGILTEDDPVELLEGWLVTKMSKNPPHSVVTGLLQDALQGMVPAGWFVNDQEPVTLEDSEPEPDITIVRGERRQYVDRHPDPLDLGLLVEVAEATLQRDRGSKKRAYARAKIPVYWIVNLIDRQIEVFTDPSGPVDKPDYAKREDFGPADTIPVMIDGKQIDRIPVKDLLP